MDHGQVLGDGSGFSGMENIHTPYKFARSFLTSRCTHLAHTSVAIAWILSFLHLLSVDLPPPWTLPEATFSPKGEGREERRVQRRRHCYWVLPFPSSACR